MIRQALISIAIGTVGSWLVTAAMLWQPDPGQWPEISRMMTVLVGAPTLAMLAFATMEANNGPH